MTKKFIILPLAIIVVVVFGVINFVKSGGAGNYIIEHVENLYNNDKSESAISGDGTEAPLGISEFFNGVTYNQLAPNVLQERIVRVSPATVASISFLANRVELLPDPGAGFAYDIQSIIGYRKFASESFGFRHTNTEGFEVKWNGCCNTASGMNGAFALGASFSRGFTTGNASNNRTSPSFEIWTPSANFLNDGAAGSEEASRSFEPTRYASASAVYLTASATFSAVTKTAVATGENGTEFFFRIIYRLVNLNF